MSKKIKLVLINCLVFLGILFVLELSVRIFHTRIRTQGTDKNIISNNVYKTSGGLTKNYTGEVFGRTVSVDNFHFRKTTIPFNASKNTVLLLGDSVTMGVGIDDENTFGALLQEKFSNLNIVNPSVIGFDTYDYVNVVSTLVNKPELNTKQLVLFFCLNDIYVRSNEDSAPMMSQKPYIGKLFDFLKTNSYLYIWLKGTFFDRQEVFFKNDQALYTENNLNEISKNLSNISNICRSNGIDFKVVVFPYEYQLRKIQDASVYEPQQKLIGQLEKIGIKTYDARDYLQIQKGDPKNHYLYADGIHFSESGHQLIFQYIVNEHLIIGK